MSSDQQEHKFRGIAEPLAEIFLLSDVETGAWIDKVISIFKLKAPDQV
ncbi:hypothetical protein METHB2_40074 [Candidatus Methylobacter favarea]|uniref:Uncharacterized protein n=1 Tax=Candidatus Methylobacter favarea TaxID=2707345 RepID=A0A8S0XT78_9GAMM|nr:hypothetical protein [Candidatus Methylobacter favarea]CAA9891374.1 hypothetical protein METHB2_40074 [Candidatus Methylobacter favarea]